MYEVNEGFILRELIYALQGVDGKLFQKDPKDMQLIIIKTEMERSTRMHVMRYLECGWLYLRLRKFLSTYNNNPSVGLVLQVSLRSSHESLGYLCDKFCVARRFVHIYRPSSKSITVSWPSSNPSWRTRTKVPIAAI